MPYDERAAQEIVEAFRQYAVHIKGPLAGQPAPLKPWQEKWLLKLFGTLDEEGQRQFHTVFVLEPKKVGKTFVAAFLCLLLISIFGEQGAEVYSLANSREQASEVFKAARQLVELSPALQELGFDPKRDIRPSTKTIYYRPFGAVYKALAAEADNLHGLGPSALVVDELHAMKDRAAIDALREGMSIWPEHLCIYITNMAPIDESEPFWQELSYAKSVAKGEIDDPTYYSCITEAPEEMSDDELLEEGPHWQAINPALGDTIPVSFYRRACLEAKNKPSMRGNVLRFHLCRPAQSFDAAIPVDQWRRCADPDLREEHMIGRQCAIGIDLSTRWDLTSITAVFPEPDGGRTWLSWSWVPRDQIDKIEKLTKKPIAKWVEDPAIPLYATDGPTIRFDVIERFLTERIASSFEVVGYVYDPKFATQLSQNLEDEGLPMVEFVPSYANYTEPWDATEARILESQVDADGDPDPDAPRMFRHAGDPVMEWAAVSLQIKRDNEGRAKPVKPDKRKHERRIDPFVAGLMAESLLIHTHEQPPLTGEEFHFA